MTRLSRVRHKVLRREYYLSAHAEEEMVEDRLERRDIESAILRGRIDKKVTRDLRGGPATGLQAPRKMAAWSMSCVGLARLAALSSSPSMQ